MHQARHATEARTGAAALRLDAALTAVVDTSLAACIFVVPLLMGGRHALGHLGLVAGAAVVTLAWTLRECLRPEFRWRRSPLEICLALGLLLLLVQVMPLGSALRACLSPRIGELLPAWSEHADGVSLGAWPTLSLAPAATRGAIPILLAYGMLMLVTVQRVQAIADVERVLKWIGWSALLMAAFGLVQWVAGNGRFFWFYQHPWTSTFDGVKGSFSNRNHFAQFLALGIGPLLAWVQCLAAAAAGPARPFAGRRSAAALGPAIAGFLGLGVVLFAALMSCSRGGAVAMLTVAAVSAAIYFRAGLLGMRGLAGIVTVGALLGAALMIHGREQVSERLGDLTEGSVESLDAHGGRRAVWASLAHAIPQFPVVGSGVGSHVDVYPAYMEQPSTGEYMHAENSPLELLLETGLVGFTVLLVGVGLCTFWCLATLRAMLVRSRATGESTGGASGTRSARRLSVCAAAITAALAANVVHATVDFVWYVPACMMIVAILAACAYRLWQLTVDAAGIRFRSVVVPRPAALGLVLAAACGGAWMVTDRVGPALGQIFWDRYQVLDVASAERSPDGPASLETIEPMLAELARTVRWDPQHARAHLRLADLYLRRFEILQAQAENVMPLEQIGDAMLAARFPSSAAAEAWLGRVVGPRHGDLRRALSHTCRALALGPMQGEGYVQMSRLCFLQWPGSAARRAAYMAQGVAVRPFDGAVLFEAGKQASLTGDTPRALEYWRRAFRHSRGVQGKLIELLACRVPIALFLDRFAPDVQALRQLHARYATLAAADQLKRLCPLYRQQAGGEPRTQEEEVAAATAWLQAQLAVLRRSYLGALRTEAERCDGEEAAGLWLETAAVYAQMGDAAGELRSAEQALHADPTSLRAHCAAARCLLAQARYAEAEPQVQWCLLRKPNDPELQALARRILDQRTDRPAATAGRGGDALR